MSCAHRLHAETVRFHAVGDDGAKDGIIGISCNHRVELRRIRADYMIATTLCWVSSSRTVPDPKTKQTIGLLAWPTPMLVALDPKMTVADAVRQIEATRAQNYPYRHFPVQELVRELGITRKGYHGLFDIIINYIPAEYNFAFEDTTVEVINLSYGFTSPWMMTIANTGASRDLAVTVDFDPGLIPTEMAASLASSLEILLQRGLDDPACPLASLPIMSEADARGGSGARCWQDGGDAEECNGCLALRHSSRTHARCHRAHFR